MKEEPLKKPITLNRAASQFVDPKTRFKLILSVYVFLVKDGKILLLRRANTGYEDGKYGLPAGHADGNETGRAAAAREALEEVGVKIFLDDLEFAHTMHRLQNDERVDYFFAAKKWQGEPKNMEPDKCDDLSWFPLNDLPDNIIPYIKQSIGCWQKGVYYSEFWQGE